MKTIALAETAFALEAQQVTAACAKIAVLPVTNQDELDDLTTGLAEAGARLKFLEESRLEETKADREKVTKRNALSKPAEEAYKTLKTTIAARITRFHADKRIADNTARASAFAVQSQAHAAARAGNLPAAAALQTQAYATLQQAGPDLEAKGTNTRREWRVRVTNKALIRPEFLIVDEKALLEHARQVLPKASPDASVEAFQVRGAEVYLHEYTAINPGASKIDRD